jgi:hypothetical protein
MLSKFINKNPPYRWAAVVGAIIIINFEGGSQVVASVAVGCYGADGNIIINGVIVAVYLFISNLK